MTEDRIGNTQSSWLQNYILEAVQKQLCMSPSCSTCGGMEFRRGLIQGLEKATGRTGWTWLDNRTAAELARTLALLRPVAEGSQMYDEAARFILTHISRSMGSELDHILAGSWAETVLDNMKDHFRWEMQAWYARRERESPEAVRALREEKRRLRQEKHDERLELKKERDRIWWETHRRPGP